MILLTLLAPAQALKEANKSSEGTCILKAEDKWQAVSLKTVQSKMKKDNYILKVFGLSTEESSSVETPGHRFICDT